MRKQLLLLLVLLPFSASAQTFQLSLPATFNLLNILDRFNRDGGILPNIGQTYGPLTLNHLGEFCSAYQRNALGARQTKTQGLIGATS